MLARVATFAIDGLESRPVSVEVDVRPGLPAFTVVGLADAAVREARERVRAAILNSGFEFPLRRITANLAPAHLRKVGPGFDLGLAVALLAASGQVPPEAASRYAVFGELSLGGELRDCRGALAVAEGTRRAGLAGIVLPRGRAREAALVDGLEVLGVATLAEAAAVLCGEASPAGFAEEGAPAELEAPEEPDLSEVRGHPGALAALELAAAGGHNLLLQGSPGTGKTMLARRLPSILPPLTRTEAIEVTRIHSVAGIHREGGLVTRRPFRAPHHTTSSSGLVGGGSVPTPGEASLAHHGVLFLDELSEFPRSSLEALRQPVEDGRVSVVRGQHVQIFPTQFMLVAATNPCPCGFACEPDRCRCQEAELSRHRRRLSGPLLDRLDLLVTVGRPGAAELAAPGCTSSAEVRERVRAARERQARRLVGTPARCNGQMDTRLVRKHVRLGAAAAAALAGAYDQHRLSARGHHRVLRVARTLADLASRDDVEARDVMMALAHRQHEDGERLAG